MTDERVTEFAIVREFMGEYADKMNLLIATSAEIYRVEGEDNTPTDDDVWRLCDANSLQIEGYILQPRRQRCYPVELIVYGADEAEYLLRVIRESAAILPALSGGALDLAAQALPGTPASLRFAAALDHR